MVKAFSNLPFLISLLVHLLLAMLISIYYLYSKPDIRDDDSFKITTIYTSLILAPRPWQKFPKTVQGWSSKQTFIHQPAPKFISSSLPQLLSTPIQISPPQSVLQVLTQFPPNVPDIQPLDIDLPAPQISINSSNYQIDNRFAPSQALVSLPSAPNLNPSSFRQLMPPQLFQVEDFAIQTQSELVFLQIGRAIVSQSEANLVDVALLVDASNSMQDDISAVINHLSHMVEVMEQAELDFTLGMAIFRFTSRMNPLFRDWVVIEQTKSIGKVVKNLTRIRCHGGERTREAVIDAISGIKFRPGAIRRFILITDEVAIGSYSLDLTLKKLSQAQIRVDVLGMDEEYQRQLAVGTGGKWISISRLKY